MLKKRFTKKISGIVKSINENPETLYIIMYIASFLNFIVSMFITYSQIGRVKLENIDGKFNDFLNTLLNTLLNNVFNKIFISLFIGLLVLYLLIILIKYFKSNKKTIIINIILIVTFVFLIIDGLFLIFDNSSNEIIVPILEKLVFNHLELILVYFAIPIVGVLCFLGMFCGKKSVKSFVLFILINGLVMYILTAISALIYALITNFIAIIVWSIILFCIIPFFFYGFLIFIEGEFIRKNKKY